MNDSNKNFRIKTNNKDKVLNVNLTRDIDFLEILSLKIDTSSAYKLTSSNYGVIVGRVLANEGFGIPNAKISVFIPIEENDKLRSEITNLYRFSNVSDSDRNGVRYNLLPAYSNDNCYQIVGTFPEKRLVLDDETVLEVYEKYFKYTTVTNDSGDYMIFGVPVGQQSIHVDLDLSDIGILSQKPRDLIYQGYNINQFESANLFKKSTNLDNLSQIVKQDQSVYVYPFWGDTNSTQVAITRCDVAVAYKFQPTCVFMGSVITDSGESFISPKCRIKETSGKNAKLISAGGKIEMIRKTTDGLVEQIYVQGNQLIDDDGVFCYQVPMNLDYVTTDEKGNIVPTDNPKKGIPTRTKVRFRFSLSGDGDEKGVRAKYLVPNNPNIQTNGMIPKLTDDKSFSEYFEYGSATSDDDFKDLFWNKVYSVKNYIPRLQRGDSVKTLKYSALKTTNYTDTKNPIPFNKVRFKVGFVYSLLCIISKIMVDVLTAVNIVMSYSNFYKDEDVSDAEAEETLSLAKYGSKGTCISFEFSDNSDGILYIPGCMPRPSFIPGKERRSAFVRTIAKFGNDNDYSNSAYRKDEGDFRVIVKGEPKNSKNVGGQDLINICSSEFNSNSDSNLEQNDSYKKALGTAWESVFLTQGLKTKIEQDLADENQIVNLDFYNDWLNGTLYFPLWQRQKDTFCKCEKDRNLTLSDLGGLKYYGDKFALGANELDPTKTLHQIKLEGGIIYNTQNKDNLNLYYYTLGNTIKDTDTFAVLYATDIVLLGSLNSCDLDGIPQLFKTLPSTTSNIPPMASLTSEDSDEVEITGMDMGTFKNQTSDESKGLFLNLDCTSVTGYTKTPINVERACELGVLLDGTQEYYADNSNTNIQQILADGKITDKEIFDRNSRSIFATLNLRNLKDTVYNPKTGYYSPKFYYTEPLRFNGALGSSRDDFFDEAYSNFRFGDKSQKFYGNDSGKYMPYYSNSFYFYFGLNEGKTAIDKFNKQYFSECPDRNTKEIFILKLKANPKVTKGVGDTTVLTHKKRIQEVNTSDNNYTDLTKKMGPKRVVDNNYELEVVPPIIELSLSDIILPYSIKVVNGQNDLLLQCDLIDGKTTDLVFDGVLSADTNTFNVIYPLPSSGGTYEWSKIFGGNYTFTITDGYGRNSVQVISIPNTDIAVSTQSVSLGEKYIGGMEASGFTKNKTYGYLAVTDFRVNDEVIKITSVRKNKQYELVSGINTLVPITGEYIITLSNGYQILLELDSLSAGLITDYLCPITLNGSIPQIGSGSVLYFGIYKPCSIQAKFTQILKYNDNGSVVTIELDDDTATYSYTILNGSLINSYINNVPLRILMDWNIDSLATYENVNKIGAFYNLNGTTNINDFENWFNVHKETDSLNNKIYQFMSISANTASYYWEEFLTLNQDSVGELTEEDKLKALVYKFKCLFNMSNATYVTQGVGNEHRMDAPINGIGLTKITSLANPYYSDLSNYYYDPTKPYEKFSLSFKNLVKLSNSTPNIVGSNFCYKNKVDNCFYQYNSESTSPFFTPIYPWSGYSGNYFATQFNDGNNFISQPLNVYLREVQAGNSVSSYNGSGLDEISYIHSKIVTTTSAETENGVEVISAATYPYFRTEFVDRRFDYDLEIALTPTGNKSSINGIKGYIKGLLYNGIEMAYDNTYNVIANNKTNEDNFLMSFNFIPLDANTNYYAVYDSNIRGYSLLPQMKKETVIGLSGETINNIVDNLDVILYSSNYRLIGSGTTGIETSGYTCYGIKQDDTLEEFSGVTYIDLIGIYNTPPSGITLTSGESKYYNSISGLVYTAIDENTWSDSGETPLHNVGYYITRNKTTYVADDNDRLIKTTNPNFYNYKGIKIKIVTMPIVNTIEDISGNTYDRYEYSYDNQFNVIYSADNGNKRLYELYLKCGGIAYDLRDVVFADGKYVDTNFETSGITTPYPIAPTQEELDKVNGVFGFDNYPTKRYIKLVNIPYSNEYSFNATSCSYNTTPKVDEQGLLSCITTPGENVVIGLQNSNKYKINGFKINTTGEYIASNWETQTKIPFKSISGRTIDSATDSGNTIVLLAENNVCYTSLDGGNIFGEVILPFGENIELSCIAYGSGTFIVINNFENEVAYSNDGLNWTLNSEKIPHREWSDMTFGNGVFVAIANNDKYVIVSENSGLTWVEYELSNSIRNWVSIVYNNNKFIAVTSDASYSASSDDNGLTWIESSINKNGLPLGDGYYSIAYGNGKWVIISFSYSGYSYDGFNWVVNSLPISGDWLSIAYGNGKFVAISYLSNDAMYSVDGINWNAATLPLGTIDWYSVTYGNGRFVAVAQNTTISAYSDDGVMWIQTALPIQRTWVSVVYGGDKFVTVAAGVDGSIKTDSALYSYNGIDWLETTMPSLQLWRYITYGNGRFVAISLDSDNAAYSDDGITWSASTMPQEAFWESIAYGNGKFVALSTNNSNIAAYSYDGVTWYQSELPLSGYWGFIKYSNGKFIAGAVFYNDIIYSYDGITWYNQRELNTPWIKTIPVETTLLSLTTNNKFCAISSNDGSSWNEYEISLTDREWKDVVYGNNLCVAISSNDKYCAVSSDSGITWSEHEISSTIRDWNTITYKDGIFIASVYNSNVLAKSIDGETWFETNLIPDYSIKDSVITDNGVIICIGYGSDLLYSYDNGSNWEVRPILPGFNKFHAIAKNGNVLKIVMNNDSYPMDNLLTSYDNGETWDVTMLDLPITQTNICDVSFDDNLTGFTNESDEFAVYNGSSYISGTTNNAKCYSYNDKIIILGYENTFKIIDSDLNIVNVTVTTTARKWVDMMSNDNLIIAIADNYTHALVSSNSGETWTERQISATAHNWSKIMFGNGIFVAISENDNYSSYSYDGVTWTEKLMNTTDVWNGLIFSNNVNNFIGISASGEIETYEHSCQGVYKPNEIELINFQVSNDEINGLTHQRYIKPPKLIVLDNLSGFTETFNAGNYDSAIESVSGAYIELKGVVVDSGVTEINTVEVVSDINSPKYGCYPISDTKEDMKNIIFGNINLSTSTPTSVKYDTIPLNGNKYVCLTDERIYLNNKPNNLIQKARVINVSNIYDMGDVTLNCIDSGIDASGNTFTQIELFSTSNVYSGLTSSSFSLGEFNGDVVQFSAWTEANIEEMVEYHYNVKIVVDCIHIISYIDYEPIITEEMVVNKTAYLNSNDGFIWVLRNVTDVLIWVVLERPTTGHIYYQTYERPNNFVSGDGSLLTNSYLLITTNNNISVRLDNLN